MTSRRFTWQDLARIDRDHRAGTGYTLSMLIFQFGRFARRPVLELSDAYLDSCTLPSSLEAEIACINACFCLCEDESTDGCMLAKRAELARKLLRMQTVQACCQQLAAAMELLQQHASAARAEQTPAQQSLAKATCRTAALLLHKTLNLVLSLVNVARAVLIQCKQDEVPAVFAELCATLRDSCVLDHIVKLQLQLLYSLAGPETNNFVNEVALVEELLKVYFDICMLIHLALAKANGRYNAHVNRLKDVVTGRCVQHFILLHAVKTLNELDGQQQLYGLDPPLAERIIAISRTVPLPEQHMLQQQQDPQQQRRRHQQSRSLRQQQLRQEERVQRMLVLDHGILIAATEALNLQPRPHPPGPRAALMLLMRIARSSIAAASAWAVSGATGRPGADDARGAAARPVAASAAAAAADTARRPSLRATMSAQALQTHATFVGGGAYYQSTTAMGADAIAVSAAGVNDAMAVPAAPRDPGHSAGRLLLVLEGAVQAAVRALVAAAEEHCGSPRWAGIMEEWWQLAVAGLKLAGTGRHAIANTGAICKALAQCLGHAMEEAGIEDIHSLPAAPPPEFVAALSAGLLPFIERCLRRVGQEPVKGSPEAAAVAAVQHYVGYNNAMSALLCYHEPSQAASLVATLAKVVGRMEPGDIGGASRWTAAMFVLTLLRDVSMLAEQGAVGRQAAALLLYAASQLMLPTAQFLQRAASVSVNVETHGCLYSMVTAVLNSLRAVAVCCVNSEVYNCSDGAGSSGSVAHVSERAQGCSSDNAASSSGGNSGCCRACAADDAGSTSVAQACCGFAGSGEDAGSGGCGGSSGDAGSGGCGGSSGDAGSGGCGGSSGDGGSRSASGSGGSGGVGQGGCSSDVGDEVAQGSSGTEAGGCGCVTPSVPQQAATGRDGAPGHEWRLLLLQDAAAVQVLTAATTTISCSLNLLTERRVNELGTDPIAAAVSTWVAVMAACPQELRAAMRPTTAAAGPEPPPLSRQNVIPQQVHSGAAPAGQSTALTWDPQAVLAVCGAAARRRDQDLVSMAHMLEMQVQGWRAGGGDNLAALNWMREVAVRRQVPAWFVPQCPLAEVRRLGAGGCPNPGCTNLDGDSEAELQSRGCGKCRRLEAAAAGRAAVSAAGMASVRSNGSGEERKGLKGGKARAGSGKMKR